MKEVFLRVKWVSQTDSKIPEFKPGSGVNRVSSKKILKTDSAIFEFGKKGKRTLSFGALILLLVFWLSAGGASASSITAAKVIELANMDRKEKGIQEFSENEKLSRAAAEKAEDMILNNYFSHTSPQGVTPWHWIEKEGYDYNYAGENLAMDFVTAEKMNEAWMASPTHRANILNEKYKEIGVAVKEGVINGHETIVVVQMFGSGDKSTSSVNEKNLLPEGERKKTSENYFPELPLGGQEEKMNDKFFWLRPFVTSPQKGEIVSEKEIEVFGRARPGSEINIFDRDKLVAVSLADDRGWFRAKVSNLEEGEHLFKVASEIFTGGKKEIYLSESDTNFRVDRAKPKIEYQLFALESKEEMMMKFHLSKQNCFLKLGSERFFVNSGEFVYVFPKKNQISISLVVEDQVGKIFQEINLANYYSQTRNNFDLVSKFASALSPQKVFASESAREAVRNNLGLITEKFNNYF